MFLFKYLLALVFVGTFSVSAQAATVVYDNYYFHNLHTVSAGESNPDLFAYSLKGHASYASIAGVLPTNSTITFTYTLISLNSSPVTKSLESLVDLSVSGAYSYKQNDKYYLGSASMDTNGHAYSIGTTIGEDGVENGLSLVSVLANFDPSTGIGTTTIINNSAGQALFYTALDVLKNAKNLAVKIGYSVVSNVPLPGALPLFALAGGALVLVRRFKKAA